ncbi:MAG: prepilin-type N-terminal cleavage/methylation domain-containing protein [Planctomycetota bacterium]
MNALEERIKRLQQRGGGFTLIELIVVISVMVVVFGISLPALRNFMEDRKLKAAGTLIMTTLNEARTNAVTQKRPVGVVFYQKGMRLYDFEGSVQDDGSVLHFNGGMRPYQSVDGIQYRLQFADLSYADIPGQPEEILDESLRDEDVTIRFESDGTIAFGRYKDVPSSEFDDERPANADIIVDYFRGGPDGHEHELKAWIDVRPQGRLAYKVAESKAQDE